MPSLSPIAVADQRLNDPALAAFIGSTPEPGSGDAFGADYPPGQQSESHRPASSSGRTEPDLPRGGNRSSRVARKSQIPRSTAQSHGHRTTGEEPVAKVPQTAKIVQPETGRHQPDPEDVRRAANDAPDRAPRSADPKTARNTDGSPTASPQIRAVDELEAAQAARSAETERPSFPVMGEQNSTDHGDANDKAAMPAAVNEPVPPAQTQLPSDTSLEAAITPPLAEPPPLPPPPAPPEPETVVVQVEKPQQTNAKTTREEAVPNPPESAAPTRTGPKTAAQASLIGPLPQRIRTRTLFGVRRR
jgi:hypothetical protein